MQVAVVDYGSGNLASASRALALAAERAGYRATVAVTADPGRGGGRRPDRAAGPGRLRRLRRAAWPPCPACARRSRRRPMRGTPFLGICVGMQLMAERGLEHTVTPGFGWIKGDVAEMPAPGLRLPQMGWNGLDFTAGCASAAGWSACRGPCLFRAQLRAGPRRAGRDHRDHRLRRHRRRHRRRRQSRRHPVPRRKKPGGWHPHAANFLRWTP